ncbi:2-iminobutanoate/2-iminopropanoate deaminase [Ixodes scapularis]|uniref:2-iminobutanoate/2-iminopropanoate deaminase n=1 Tax=Ixodes scapularis TaxID=6945 RepID=UPI001A9F254E|nr:2-iminobutanoate/2-iminopropanoate deaminase [Ixodes scapularis]
MFFRVGDVRSACLTFVLVVFSVGTLEASLDGSRQVITSPLVARPVNPYSHAICVGNTMYLSGQLGSHPQTGRIVPGGIVPETRQALTNLANILDAGQMTLRDVVKVNVYIADMKDYEAMNRIYAEFFTEKYPARVTIRAAEIPGRGRIEIDAIAVDTSKAAGPRPF